MKKIEYIPQARLRNVQPLSANRQQTKTHVSVIPTPAPMRDDQQYIYQISVLTLIQLCLDSMDRLINTKTIKGKYKWEKAKIYDSFNKMRRQLKRSLQADEFEFVENAIYDIIDNLQPYIDNIYAAAKTEFAQKMPYNLVDAAVLLGMCHGCTSVINTINRKLTGKNNPLINTISENLSIICDKVEFYRLNPTDEIDPNHSLDAWLQLLAQLPKQACVLLQSHVEKQNSYQQ